MKKYDITKSDSHQYIYYRVPKTATRSVLKYLEDTSKIDFGHLVKLDGYNVTYHEEWNSYFKFAFVRNPFDRLLSCFLDKTKKVIGTEWEIKRYVEYKDYSFEAFIDDLTPEKISLDGHTKEQYVMINLDQIDFIGRFENFEHDFKYVINKLNLQTRNIEHFNHTKHEHYTKYYTEEMRTKVQTLYARDLEIFGYEY